MTRSGSEEEIAKVGRTLGHQDPNLGLAVKARHCPGSRQVCWARLQILAEEARPRQSPRLMTQANHRRSYSELLGWLGLTVTQGSQDPFSSKGPELEGNKGEQEIGLQVFPARCPGFLVSLLDVGTESRHHQSEELESDSRLPLSDSLADISPWLSKKHSGLPWSKQNFWFIVISPLNLTLPGTSSFQ